MKNIDILAIKSVCLSEVFDAPAEEPKDILFAFDSDGERLEARNNSLTLVLDRDIQRSTDHAAAVAVHLAVKYPTRTVLLINTYAGPEQMQSALVRGLAGLDILLPSKWKYRKIAQEKNVQFSDSQDAELPENLRVLSCPYATLTTKLIDSEVAAHKCDIVILNSFEFASLSAYTKSLLAGGLLSLQINRKLSMIVYSQDRHKGLSTYSLGRGPIGSLAPHSMAIWRLYGG
ncbi:MAG: hypothetical protein ACHQNE_02910 [Candidatus Kapaibacterium sp.]